MLNQTLKETLQKNSQMLKHPYGMIHHFNCNILILFVLFIYLLVLVLLLFIYFLFPFFFPFC